MHLEVCVLVCAQLVNTDCVSVMMNSSRFLNQTSVMLGGKPEGEIRTGKQREGKQAGRGLDLLKKNQKEKYLDNFFKSLKSVLCIELSVFCTKT